MRFTAKGSGAVSSFTLSPQSNDRDRRDHERGCDDPVAERQGYDPGAEPERDDADQAEERGEVHGSRGKPISTAVCTIVR